MGNIALIKNFLDYLTIEKRYSVHTTASYQNDLNQFNLYLSESYSGIEFHKVEMIHVRSFMVHLLESKLAKSTVARKISCIKSLYKFLKKEQLISSSPVQLLDTPKVDSRLPVFLKEEEVVNLFEEFDFEDFSIIKDTILKSMRNSMFNPSQCLVRTEHCQNVGGCDERIGFSQEYSLTLRLSVLGKFARLNHPVAILPLNAKDNLPDKAKEIYNQLKIQFSSQYDEKDSIGKRYRRQDAIGTPFCITVDYESLETNKVTIRNRDSMKQERVSVDKINKYLEDNTSLNILLNQLD